MLAPNVVPHQVHLGSCTHTHSLGGNYALNIFDAISTNRMSRIQDGATRRQAALLGTKTLGAAMTRYVCPVPRPTSGNAFQGDRHPPRTYTFIITTVIPLRARKLA